MNLPTACGGGGGRGAGRGVRVYGTFARRLVVPEKSLPPKGSAMLTRFKQAEQNAVPEVLAAQLHIRTGTLSVGNGHCSGIRSRAGRQRGGGGEREREGGVQRRGHSKEERQGDFSAAGRQQGGIEREECGCFSAGGETARWYRRGGGGGAFQRAGRQQGGEKGGLFSGRGDSKERKWAFQWVGRQQGGERGGLFSGGETARERERGLGGGGFSPGLETERGAFQRLGKKRVLIERCNTQTAIEAFVSKSSNSSALRGFLIRALLFHRLGAPLCGAPSRSQGSAAPPQSGTPAAPSGGCDQTVTC